MKSDVHDHDRVRPKIPLRCTQRDAAGSVRRSTPTSARAVGASLGSTPRQIAQAGEAQMATGRRLFEQWLCGHPIGARAGNDRGQAGGAIRLGIVGAEEHREPAGEIAAINKMPGASAGHWK